MQHQMQGTTARRMEGVMGDVTRTGGTDGVAHFAAEVLARLVKSEAVAGSVLNETLVLRLMRAVSTGDPEAFGTLRADFKRARVSAAVLADHYIPEVARRLGKGWAEDCVTFADVTMGTARLQAMLREIGQDWYADSAGAAVGPTLLVIIPEGEHHTLGAMVLAARLRRSGVSVSLRIGDPPPVLATFVRDRSFDAALISVACHEKLETSARLVKTLKDATKGRLKIALGGAVLATGEYCASNTGADVVTNDIEAALKGLGLLEHSAERERV